MKDFFNRLTSRKFLLTVVLSVYFIHIGQFDLVQWIVLAYFGVEGGADIAQRITTQGVAKARVEQGTAAINQGLPLPGSDSAIVPGTPPPVVSQDNPVVAQPATVPQQYVPGGPQ